MRVAITGTTRGLGKAIKNTLCARWIPVDFNRPEYDISTKEGRKKIIDEVQRDIQLDKNQKFIGECLEVLVDGRERGKWKGRTRSDKLVFFEAYCPYLNLQHALIHLSFFLQLEYL